MKNISPYLDNIPIYISLFVAIGLTFSIFYDLIFFNTLGLSLIVVPSVISDQLRQTFNWAPVAIFVFVSCVAMVAGFRSGLLESLIRQVDDNNRYFITARALYASMVFAVITLVIMPGVLLFTAYQKVVYIPDYTVHWDFLTNSIILFTFLMLLIVVKAHDDIKKKLHFTPLTIALGSILSATWCCFCLAVHDAIHSFSNCSRGIEITSSERVTKPLVLMRAYNQHILVWDLSSESFRFIESSLVGSYSLSKQIEDSCVEALEKIKSKKNKGAQNANSKT
ncbi:hypothetical protein P886_3080 [Alteromonadaceae bacterium 2753L.S.0a.02]|nr:hypothetical protein P886_3080 [Alteromonadaceae bacterium 2753L.S.0a.02]